MQEVTEVFSYFDKDGSGQISFDEFLVALRVCNMFYSDLYSSPSLLVFIIIIIIIIILLLLILQSTPDNSNLQGKSKKVRVIGSSSYRGFKENNRE